MESIENKLSRIMETKQDFAYNTLFKYTQTISCNIQVLPDLWCKYKWNSWSVIAKYTHTLENAVVAKISNSCRKDHNQTFPARSI